MAKKNFKSGMDFLLQGSKNHIEAEKKTWVNLTIQRRLIFLIPKHCSQLRQLPIMKGFPLER